MRTDFQYEFADYREANLAHSTPPGWGSRISIAVILAVSAGCVGWAALGTVPASASGTIVSDVDFCLSLLAFLPLYLTLAIGIILGRSRFRPARRRFDNITSKNTWFCGANVIFGNLILGLIAAAIFTHRQSGKIGLTPGGAGKDSSWIDLLPWAVGVVFLWLVLRGRYKRAWKQQPALQRPRSLELSKESITTSDDLITTTYRWPAFGRCVETSNLFLLYPSGLQFIMVPKRIFPSGAEIENFRQLIREWASGLSVGFAVILPVPDLTDTIIRPTGPA